MNDEARLTNAGFVMGHSSLVIQSDFWFRHSSFVIHSSFATPRSPLKLHLSLPELTMHPTQSEYHLTDSLDVPEIAPLPTIRSERAATVAKWFGIDDLVSTSNSTNDSPPDHRTDRALLRSLLPRAGQIVFLTGPSGAGKSSMLR